MSWSHNGTSTGITLPFLTVTGIAGITIPTCITFGPRFIGQNPGPFRPSIPLNRGQAVRALIGLTGFRSCTHDKPPYTAHSGVQGEDAGVYRAACSNNLGVGYHDITLTVHCRLIEIF